MRLTGKRASVETDFVKTLYGQRHTGSCNTQEDSRKSVAIMQKAGSLRDLPNETVFRYKVCDNPSKTKNPAAVPPSGALQECAS